MSKIYSYILKIDSGSAPNPFWGTCTLAICKPAIRRTAQVGDWIIGTGSKNSLLKDLKPHNLSGKLVYAMKVTRKLSMEAYDELCKTKLKRKVPNWRTKNWKDKVGDCIYDFSKKPLPSVRLSVHTEKNRAHDLGGRDVLLSNHFYYFGQKAKQIPESLSCLIKESQGHLVKRDDELIRRFEKWISKFPKNKNTKDPQRRWAFDKKMTRRNLIKCSFAKSQYC